VKRIHPNIRVYLLGTLLVLLAGSILLVSFGKVEGHLFVNRANTPFLDFFFTYYTHVGGGVSVVVGSILLSVLFWKRYQISIFLLATLNLVLVAASTQLLKHLVFDDAARPIQFIGREFLHTAPGVEIHTSNSFPSGHTAAGFAFFAFVSFLYGRKMWVQLLCVLAALLVGFSRIYLSQHFLEDAVFGGSIGLVCFLLSYFIVRKLKVGKSISQ